MEETLQQRRERWKLYMREYRKKNHKSCWNSDEYIKNLTSKIRIKALQKISPEIKCVNCGYDESPQIIEINHKNGNGTKEIKEVYLGHSREFYRAIVNGNRQTDDLELLCKVCNTLHHIQENLGIKGHQVIYVGTEV